MNEWMNEWIDGSMDRCHEAVFCWVPVSSLVLIIPWWLAHLLLFLFYPPAVCFFFFEKFCVFSPWKWRSSIGKI
jgi:hypothetical protein